MLNQKSLLPRRQLDYVGKLQGRGRMDRTHRAEGTRKDILLFPLLRQWRRQLCQTC